MVEMRVLSAAVMPMLWIQIILALFTVQYRGASLTTEQKVEMYHMVNAFLQESNFYLTTYETGGNVRININPQKN